MAPKALTSIVELMPSRKTLIVSLLIVTGLYSAWGGWKIVQAISAKTSASSQNMSGVFGGTGPKMGGSKQKETDLSDFDVESHIAYGAKLLEAGNPEGAIRHFRRAEVILQEDPELSLKIGDALFLMGRFQEAEVAYEAAMERKEYDPGIQAKLGLSVLNQGKLDKAISTIKRAIRSDPQCGECYSALGRCLSSVIPEREGALKAFTRALVLSPDNAEVHYYFAKYLMERGEYGEAASLLKQLTGRFPLHAKAHARLGIAYYHMARYRESSREFEVALEINPNDFNSWYNLGEIYYHIRNNAEQATSCYSESVALHPNHAKAHFRLGLISFRNGQYRESAGHFEKTRGVEPTNIENLLQLAVAYEKLNQTSEALSVYQDILEQAPLNDIARQKVDLISSGSTAS